MRRHAHIGRLAVAGLLVATAIPLVGAVLDLPSPNDPDAPVWAGIAARYLEQGQAEAGVESIVTAVLLEYRAYDTFGEAAVIFTALVAVLAVMHAARDPLAYKPAADRGRRDDLTRYVVVRATPVIVLFGAYLAFEGYDRPGGAFQGAVVGGAALILLTLVLDRDHVHRLVPMNSIPWLAGASMVTFLGFVLLGTTMESVPFAYPTAGLLGGLKHEIKLILEAGIAAAGAVIIATIFWALRGSR